MTLPMSMLYIQLFIYSGSINTVYANFYYDEIIKALQWKKQRNSYDVELK